MSLGPWGQTMEEWVADVMEALRRARRRAEAEARRAGTDLVFMENGKLVFVKPPPADDESREPEGR